VLGLEGEDNIMKKLMICVLTAVTIMGMSAQAFAADLETQKSKSEVKEDTLLISNYAPKDLSINKVVIRGKNIELGKNGVLIYKGKIMVPLKTTSESLGFKVEADKDNKIISLDNGEIKTNVYVGEDSYYYSSSKAIGLTMMHALGAEPIIDNNTIYVPINIYNFLFNDQKTLGSFFVRNKDGEWIYSINGELTTGWKLINNKWYFMNNNGIMQRGWVQTNGNWYYLLNNGEMAASIVTPDGFKVDESGKWDGNPANILVTQTANINDIINPIEGFDTIEEAQKALKFKVTIPNELLGKYNIKYINTISRNLFQICYANKQNDILFRMAQGTEDISGDYNNYKTNNIVDINGNKVKLKGDDKIIKVAVWSVNNISYSISVTDGMKQDDIINIIKSTF